MNKISLDKKFSLFSDRWRPKTIAELNGQEVKIVKVQGEFPWHRHDNEDAASNIGRVRTKRPDSLL